MTGFVCGKQALCDKLCAMTMKVKMKDQAKWQTVICQPKPVTACVVASFLDPVQRL